MMRSRRVSCLLLASAALSLSWISDAFAGDLPAGFVRLAEVDASIRQDMRYAGSLNFLGRPAKGYEAPVCILTEPAAEALAATQRRLAGEGLTLVVFDCYRPAAATADFIAWSASGETEDPRWHPKVKRRDLIAEGYIGVRSSHSRGSTVDAAIAPLEAVPAPSPPCGVGDARTLDFGTGFDCFDKTSETAHRPLTDGAQANRLKLVETMKAAGFRNYSREWWHFTLRKEPYPEQLFDFPVTADE